MKSCFNCLNRSIRNIDKTEEVKICTGLEELHVINEYNEEDANECEYFRPIKKEC